MSMNNIDLEALQRDLEAFALEQSQKGWFRRNWLWFVPVLLLLVVVIGGGAAYWSLFLRIYNLELCQSAMQAIQANQDLQNTLGQPIQFAYHPNRESTPNARIEADEIELRWNVEGSKSHAKAHLLAKNRQGKWDTVVLEVILPNERKVSLADAVGDADDAPKFDAPKKEPAVKSQTTAPPPEINLMAPPGDVPEVPANVK